MVKYIKNLIITVVFLSEISTSIVYANNISNQMPFICDHGSCSTQTKSIQDNVSTTNDIKSECDTDKDILESTFSTPFVCKQGTAQKIIDNNSNYKK